MADDTSSRKKRLVRDPETFRERAAKASEESEKPHKRRIVSRAGAKVASPAAKPFKATGRFLKRFRVFRMLGRVLLPKYFRTSWQELKGVKWPTWSESRRLTFAVLVFAAVFGISIAVVDYGLDKLFRHILLK